MKYAYRDTFSDAHIQYHEFDNKDLLTVRDKYTALLQQELIVVLLAHVKRHLNGHKI